MSTQKELILDGTKLAWHLERVEQWQKGERIAPVTIDMALTRACNYSCGFCYAMFQENGRSVIVSNTMTSEEEVLEYHSLTKELNVKFISVILENRHNGKSIHNVPISSIEKMKKRFDIKLC